MDTAGTALWLLGVDTPDGWSGRPVRGAFTELAQTTADLATSSSTRAAVGNEGEQSSGR
jgi:hypothetical protein